MNTVLSGKWLVCLVALAFLMGPQASAQEVRPPDTEGSSSELGRPREGGLERTQVMQEDGKVEEGTQDGMPHFRGGAKASDLWPHWPPANRPHWRFGIFAYNTDTGIVVTGVEPNSAAWRLNVEPGDRVVAVNGFQVGWVQNRLYPFASELQLRADRRGVVTLLLQNVRNNQLLTRQVQLDRIGAGPWPRRR